MTEFESIRDADDAYEAREAIYCAERYDDGHALARRMDEYKLEILAEADRIRLARKMVDVFTGKRVA
jgi:hypothetical protein